MIGYFDGASRGNPGESGAGACLLDDGGDILWESCRYLGVKTNNEAEYQALIDLLTEVVERGIPEIEVRGDSQLVICQATRVWKINRPHLMILANQVWEKMKRTQARLVWIPREKNQLADELSNRAIDCKDTLSLPQPWNGPQKSALVLEILREKLTPEEAAKKHKLELPLVRQWVSTALEAMTQSLGGD